MHTDASEQVTPDGCSCHVLAAVGRVPDDAAIADRPAGRAVDKRHIGDRRIVAASSRATVTGTSLAYTADVWLRSGPPKAGKIDEKYHKQNSSFFIAETPFNAAARGNSAQMGDSIPRPIPNAFGLQSTYRAGAGNAGSADRASNRRRACCELDFCYDARTVDASLTESPTMNDVTSRVEQMAARAAALYSRPTVALEIVRLTSEPQVDPRVLKELLEKDPALTCKILRVVNSSFFGLRREVSDLNQALGLLGQQAAAIAGARLQPAGRTVHRYGGRATRMVLADDAHAGRRRAAARHRAVARFRATRRSSPA